MEEIPLDVRKRLVVRSQPFGDIIDNETRKIYDLHDGSEPRDRYLKCSLLKMNVAFFSLDKPSE